MDSSTQIFKDENKNRTFSNIWLEKVDVYSCKTRLNFDIPVNIAKISTTKIMLYLLNFQINNDRIQDLISKI